MGTVDMITIVEKTVQECGITREHVNGLQQNYPWLAELGEEYKRDTELARDTYLFLQNMLDIEDGIEQGYLKRG